jgi:single-strand DNA-binding protein
MNIITIAGRLGVDPEVRFTSNGQKVTTFRIATTSRRSSKEETIWWRITIWGENFDKMISFLKKGSAVIVVGELHKPEIFNDREGKPQVSLNVTATSINFSPFGKSDKQDSNKPAQDNFRKSENANRQDNNEDVRHKNSESNENEEEFSSFTPGAKKGDSDSEFLDDEIPF